MPGLIGFGGTTINYPDQQGYGEALSESLKAQTDLLRGTGEFRGTGGLEELVREYEAPLRKTTAQIDTDVLRTTLLGSDVTYNEDGKILDGYKDAEGKIIETPKAPIIIENANSVNGKYNSYEILVYPPELADSLYVDDEFGNPQFQNPGGATLRYDVLDEYDPSGPQTSEDQKEMYKGFLDVAKEDNLLDELQFNEISKQIDDTPPGTYPPAFIAPQGDVPPGATPMVIPKQEVEIPKDATPVFRKDKDGNEIVRPDLANRTISAEDGMIDLLGDKQLTADGRQPGFDAQGNFLGLSALAEDIQRGNLSRQREADLADVERLSGRFQDVMEDFRPGTAEAVTGAREVLESQKDRLTGGEGQITVPTADTFGGAATAIAMRDNILGEGPTLTADTSFDAATAADPMALTAATSFDPSAGVTGEGFTATAGLEGGQIAADPLRTALMAQAQEGLSEGLTDREERQIAEAARARATMMGRTFDQSEAIREAEARVLEDRNRQAQNRAFAQQVLGQEAGLQESDLSRSLQAAMQNQAALNRAAEFTAGQGMQAQLANQAATNQALQAGMAAGLSQEALAAQQQQAREFANMQAQNRASEFGTQAGMQQDLAQAGIDQERDVLQAQLNQQQAAFNAEAAQQRALADQRQKQQAAQFGVGAQMDAERLNAQLAQQGALGYVDAATRLAALEDQTTLDPFSALLNRAGGGSLGQAGQVFGQANYGLSSGPQYLNPESGLGYISQMAANEASMYGAQQMADASRGAGLLGGLGAIGGGLFQGAGAAQGFGNLFCWVAREVYGPMNPQWMQFRDWMFAESPRWFFNLYRRFGERFANWISDKPRIKAIIRKWMDSKIGDK